MYEVLKDILVSDLQVKEEDITPTAAGEEVGLDSLAVIELATTLSERLDIEVHDYELREAPTLAHVAKLIAERRSAD